MSADTTVRRARRSYYVHYPRNFSNEYEVFAVSKDVEADLLRLYPGSRRISYSEAVRLGMTRVLEARRDGEYWLGGFHNIFTPCRRELSRDIDECERQTVSTVRRMLAEESWLEECRIRDREER